DDEDDEGEDEEDWDDEDDDDMPEILGRTMNYVCPFCNQTLELNPRVDSMNPNFRCPHCGRKLFL
ncbi:MAG: hypothetical protein IJ083_01020, partial [Clostridia bacterium]|nr:hypothetical protein [Clostridia bacterium]